MSHVTQSLFRSTSSNNCDSWPIHLESHLKSQIFSYSCTLATTSPTAFCPWQVGNVELPLQYIEPKIPILTPLDLPVQWQCLRAKNLLPCLTLMLLCLFRGPVSSKNLKAHHSSGLTASREPPKPLSPHVIFSKTAPNWEAEAQLAIPGWCWVTEHSFWGSRNFRQSAWECQWSSQWWDCAMPIHQNLYFLSIPYAYPSLIIDSFRNPSDIIPCLLASFAHSVQHPCLFSPLLQLSHFTKHLCTSLHLFGNLCNSLE